jgi:hypothetical protein
VLQRVRSGFIKGMIELLTESGEALRIVLGVTTNDKSPVSV